MRLVISSYSKSDTQSMANHKGKYFNNYISGLKQTPWSSSTVNELQFGQITVTRL
uniref:Uncharacterized protein n=2 Tax=Anguilla anguilla TaxID=7936 RepID=A0A0E9VWT3_ANGAN